MNTSGKKIIFLLIAILIHLHSQAQGDAKVSARIDAAQITIGDQVRLFIEAQHNSKQSRIEWATIPDTFEHLEVVEKGKIDTTVQGDIVTYKQRLLITGFDSGLFVVPALTFTSIPNGGQAYTLRTDSFRLSVQSVQVDTTKAFKPIKGIMQVKSNWKDYLLYIGGGLLLIGLIVFVILYFIKNKKVPAPIDNTPKETLQEKTIRELTELEQKELWQKNQVKEYYIQLTDIIRSYIEDRFHTPALELTTDELLYKARLHKELQPFQQLLSVILNTADLAKFAKGQPLPQEHTAAMDYAKQFVNASKPVVTEPQPQQP